jgi:hypothetical protein
LRETVSEARAESLGVSFSSGFGVGRSDTVAGVFHVLPPAASNENESSVFTKSANILRSTLKLAWNGIGGGKAIEGTYEEEGAEK